MIEEEGVVIQTTGKTAKVKVLKKSACESCAAAGMCRAGTGDYAFFVADNPLGAKQGQRVKILIAPQAYVQSPLVRYGVPVVALVAGAIVAKNLAIRFAPGTNPDSWALFAGTFCLVLSFILIRMYNKTAAAQGYKPVIIEIL